MEEDEFDTEAESNEEEGEESGAHHTYWPHTHGRTCGVTKCDCQPSVYEHGSGHVLAAWRTAM